MTTQPIHTQRLYMAPDTNTNHSQISVVNDNPTTTTISRQLDIRPDTKVQSVLSKCIGTPNHIQIMLLLFDRNCSATLSLSFSCCAISFARAVDSSYSLTRLNACTCSVLLRSKLCIAKCCISPLIVFLHHWLMFHI